MDLDDVRRMALALPGAEEGTWFGLPTFRVRSKFFAGMAKDGASLVLRCDGYERKHLMEAEPDVYFVTDHYRGDPYVLVRLRAIGPDALRERIEESWRMAAPKRLVAELEAAAAPADPVRPARAGFRSVAARFSDEGPMNADEVRRMALAFPGVEEDRSGGTTSFRVRRTLFARLRDGGETLVLKCNLFERKYLLEDFPDVFYLGENYRDYPFVYVRAAAVTPELLRERMEAAYRMIAPKKLVAELDRGPSAPG